MKKTLLITVCLFGILLAGCGVGTHTYKNKKADDAISRAIYEAMGEELYYLEKNVGSNNVIYYRYLFYKEQEGQLAKLLETVNTVIQQEEITEKIEITCCVKPPGAGEPPVISFGNYSDAGKEVAEYSSLQKLWISGTIHAGTIYRDPSAYSNLQGIKHLEISWDMATFTERDKIDWYEYFPDLETLEIIPKEN